jgi:hypothetical protein
MPPEGGPRRAGMHLGVLVGLLVLVPPADPSEAGPLALSHLMANRPDSVRGKKWIT